MSVSSAPGICILALVLTALAANIQVTIPVNEWYTTRGSDLLGTGPEAEEIIQWGVQDAWRYDFMNQSVDVDLVLEFRDSEGASAIAVKNVIEWATRGMTLAIGYPLSEVAVSSAEAGTTYGMAQISSSASSEKLSDERKFPYFSRLAPSSDVIAAAVVDTLLHMVQTQGLGWRRIALLTSSDQDGVSTAQSLISQAMGTAIEIVTWENILPEAQSIAVEVSETGKSDARVVVAFCSSGYDLILQEAQRQGILDGGRVFIGGPAITDSTFYRFANGTIDSNLVDLMRGHLGISVYLNTQGDRYDRFLRLWTTTPSRVNSTRDFDAIPNILNELQFDLGVLTAHTVVEARRQGLLDHDRRPTATEWIAIARSVVFDGASGIVKLNENGDRPMSITLSNFRAEQLTWEPVGVWTPGRGLELFEDQPIIWRDNTTNYPDLLLGPGYSYWSCSEGKKLFDDTGHSVKLHTPDTGDFDDIDAAYICDHFIDCPNMSDESGDCSANYTALFIAFGIITGLLIVMTCCLIPFVIVFGFIIPRRRVKASSPTFLLIIILSCMLGYISEYSWYGRPHPVACGFRPWLLGLAVVSLVSALNAKTWRLWRIFKIAYKKERITVRRLTF